MTEKKISAYILTFNNASSVPLAIESIRSQTVPIDEIFVIDDGSTDNSAKIVESLGVKLLRQPKNLGRGAGRARAMSEARNELVLCCDATNVLAPDFVQRAAPWFNSSSVAGIFGRFSQLPARNVVDRWRGRHLFKIGARMSLTHKASLVTAGALMRRSIALAVGNYDSSMKRGEDAELGARLLGNSFDVIFDPELTITSVVQNSLSQVLERYWRWNEGVGEGAGIIQYLRNVSYSIKVMAYHDLREKDLLAIPISLLCPHVQMWRSWTQVN